jgi:hypothetical protein
MCETVSCFICRMLFVEVLHVTLLALISVSAALRLPNPVLRMNSFSIAMWS